MISLLLLMDVLSAANDSPQLALWVRTGASSTESYANNDTLLPNPACAQLAVRSSALDYGSRPTSATPDVLVAGTRCEPTLVCAWLQPSLSDLTEMLTSPASLHIVAGTAMTSLSAPPFALTAGSQDERDYECPFLLIEFNNTNTGAVNRCVTLFLDSVCTGSCSE